VEVEALGDICVPSSTSASRAERARIERARHAGGAVGVEPQDANAGSAEQLLLAFCVPEPFA